MAFHSFLERFIRKLFPKVTRYSFSRASCAAMRAMSLDTHPKEAFGVFVGAPRAGTLYVKRVIYQPFVNTETSATVVIDPHLAGTVGTFHSHPGGNAQPSTADRRLFAKHPGIHCIVSEPYTHAHVYDHHARFLGVEPLI